jgi:hypothetical protein
MSGPKVVRVVTREELLARALDQIASFESALARYATLGRRHDVDLSADLETHRRVVTELKSLAQTGAWDVIARRSADSVRIVEHERKALEEKLITAATKDRTVRRRLGDAAKAIQREIRGLNLEVPGELLGVIANVDKATPDELRRMDAAVVAASKILVQHTSKSKQLDSKLAKRLATGLNQDSYADWLVSNAVGEESQKLVRLDKIVAELQLQDLAKNDTITAAIQRVQTADDSERDLLIDSLTLDLSERLKQNRQRRDELGRLDAFIPRLESVGSTEAQDLLGSMRAALTSDKGEDIRGLELRAAEILKASRAKANAIHQRKALLSGLTALGYEVREGMAIALVENGRLVVKKPAEVEYGVEIVSGAADGRLQVRMVCFQGTPNPTRDRDTEVIWCGEFSKLQASLSRAGHVLEIEKGLAPGAAPMKREQLPLVKEDAVEVGIKRPQTRTL